MIIASLMLVSPAAAHDLKLQVKVSGMTLNGMVTIGNGEPVPKADISLRIKGDTTDRQRTSTDASGKFSVTVDKVADWEVIASIDEVHQVRTIVSHERLVAPTSQTVEASSNHPASSHGTNQPAADQSKLTQLEHENQSLRAELAHWQKVANEQSSLTGWRHVGAGIGYILGVFGIIVLAKSVGRRA